MQAVLQAKIRLHGIIFRSDLYCWLKMIRLQVVELVANLRLMYLPHLIHEAQVFFYTSYETNHCYPHVEQWLVGECM